MRARACVCLSRLPLARAVSGQGTTDAVHDKAEKAGCGSGISSTHAQSELPNQSITDIVLASLSEQVQMLSAAVSLLQPSGCATVEHVDVKPAKPERNRPSLATGCWCQFRSQPHLKC